jgi:glycosyltransferase involved in cell wall biosynthesis
MPVLYSLDPGAATQWKRLEIVVRGRLTRNRRTHPGLGFMQKTIAHINLARGFRGGERQTELLIRGLAGGEYRQVLVARRGSALQARLADADVEIRPVSGGLFAAARATGRSDLVHVHEGRAVYAAFLRSLLSGTPYVITRRVNNPLGHGYLTRLAYRRAAFVAAVARDIADIMRRFDERVRVMVVHSGSSGLSVDAAESSAIRKRFPDKWLVGNVGALDNAQKGQQYIIEVAHALQFSHPAIQFLLVGGGEDEEMLRESASDLGNLTFTGFVENVGDYLAALDIFILPSNKEGIGGILLDAMEQSLPVIASRVGGLPEIVLDGDNGLLIDAARPDQLHAAILRLYENPTLAHDLGERGRQFAKHYTAEVMCRKYLELYDKTLARRAGEGS